MNQDPGLQQPFSAAPLPTTAADPRMASDAVGSSAVAPADAPLQARGLRYAVGNRQLLDGIDLAVTPGSILGLVGRNGAGKSTLLSCLLGLILPQAGEARLLGQPAAAIGDVQKQALGYVPQQPEGFDSLTVGAMLAMVAPGYPSWDWARVERLLATWQLDANRPMLRLSPGERQQVAIVRALAPRPQLLVMDEPAAALDPLARRQLLAEVADLAAEAGTTVVFATHIISDLERVASHIALLDQGRLRFHTALDAIKEDWCRLWWPSGTPLPEALLPGEVARRPLDDGGWHVVLQAAPSGITLPAGARCDVLSLEDLFVAVVA